jgi:hypothetical protein
LAKKAKVYTGTEWVDLAAATTDLSQYQKSNRTGLQIVVPTSVTGGTVSANGQITIGSAVTSISVNGAFSSAYDNYKIILSGIDCSTVDNIITLSLNNSSGSTYNYATRWVNYSTANFSGVVSGTPKTSFAIGLTSTNDNNNHSLELQNCFNAKPTTINIQGTSDTNMVWGGGLDTNAVSHTAFTIASGVLAFTGGTIRIYGYNNGL